jgi:hypothetical protein
MFMLEDWQRKHGISDAAMVDLFYVFQPDGTRHEDGKSESATSRECELIAARYGQRLWRNNSGALKNEDDVMIRYGLGNTSQRINTVMKSSDYIGIKTILIQPHHVGTKIGQFIAAEMKKPGWHLIPSDKRGQAQATFGAVVTHSGGLFNFISHPSQFEEMLK